MCSLPLREPPPLRRPSHNVQQKVHMIPHAPSKKKKKRVFRNKFQKVFQSNPPAPILLDHHDPLLFDIFRHSKTSIKCQNRLQTSRKKFVGGLQKSLSTENSNLTPEINSKKAFKVTLPSLHFQIIKTYCCLSLFFKNLNQMSKTASNG